MCFYHHVLFLPKKNPAIAKNINVLASPMLSGGIASLGIVFLTGFLIIHIWKDLNAALTQWYFHSTYIWLIVMGMASLIYFLQLKKLRENGVDLKTLFNKLPTE